MLRKHVYPTSVSFNGSDSQENFQLLPKLSNIFSSHATRGRMDLVSAIAADTANWTQTWFNYTVMDESVREEFENKKYLENATNQALKMLLNPLSNFYPSYSEANNEGVTFGTGLLKPNKDKKNKLIRYQSIAFAHVYTEENDNGIVDTLYIPKWYTGKQMMSEYPESFEDEDNSLNRWVVQKMKESPDYKFKVLISIMPNHLYKAMAPKTETNKPYASLHILIDEGKDILIRESGFDTFPMYLYRWERMPGNDGVPRSPAMYALDDAQIADEMMRNTLNSAEKMLRPPLQGPNTSFLNRINISAGAFNRYRQIPGQTAPKIEPIVTVGNIPISLELMQDVRNSIKRHFFGDLIEQDDKKAEMTALEAQTREQTRLKAMAPHLMRIQTEMLTDLLIDLFEFMLEVGLIDEPPESLKNEGIVPMFLGPLNIAMRSNQVGALQRFANFATALAGIDQNLLESLDGEAMLENMREAEGVTTKILKDKEQVAKDREARAQAENRAAEIDQAKVLSEVGLNSARATSELGV